MAGGAAVFLVMFTGLVVTTTLLVTQSNQSEAAALATARGLEEPTLPALDNTVARQDVSLLQSDSVAETPGLATPVEPVQSEVTPETPKPASIEVAAATFAPLGLGADHRYRVPSCVDYLDTLVKITTVNFPLGSDKPADADMIRARNIATAVETCEEVKVIVEGHSDRRGDEQLNMELSWLRAQSVIDQLQREGFDISAMQPRGFGAKRPINLSGTISGEAVNRRVQFTLAPRRASSTVRVSGN
ncbi:OmpA family protein [Tateyamaria armeniaca]|uniref:OmpA family protein n=1 Tax=Tateyamaria armeniaca TaxID=2518930 RepID=A0ABW8URM6_9RHOB